MSATSSTGASGATQGPMPTQQMGANNSQKMFNQLQTQGPNPYYNQLAGTYQQNADRALGQAFNSLDQRTGANGMAGSSRAGIAQGMAMRDVNTDLQNNLNNLAYQGYNQNIQNQMSLAQSADQAAMQKYNADMGFAGTQYGADASRQASMYGADQGLAGTQYSSDASKAASMYGADASREASKYSADQGLAGTRYSSDASKAASMYGADKGAQASMYGADKGAQASMYGSDAARQASMYGADKSSAASMYGADKGAQASMYGSDAARQASMYGADKGYASSIYGSDISRYLGELNNSTQRYGMDQNYAVGMGGVANDAAQIANNYNLGMGRLNTDNNAILAQMLGGMNGSMQYGQGQVGDMMNMGGYELSNLNAPMNLLQQLGGIIGNPTVLGSASDQGFGAGSGSAIGMAGGGGVGGSGGGGSSGGGRGISVICNELKRQNLLPEYLLAADEDYGKLVRTFDPAVYAGYISWAPTVVKAMRKSKWVTKLVAAIALPWAHEMGRVMGVGTSGGVIGRAVMAVGVPACRMIGEARRPKLAEV